MTDERVRLFVALELPAKIRDALVDWRSEPLAAEPSLRAIGPEALHVTLCFLGWRWLSEIAPIAQACGIVAGQPPAELSLGKAVWLPRRRPRVLAVELEDRGARLARIEGLLSRALADGGWYRPEKRPFLAHVTVARVGKGGHVSRVELRDPPATDIRAGTVTLFRSRLSPGGARYEPLHSVELQ